MHVQWYKYLVQRGVHFSRSSLRCFGKTYTCLQSLTADHEKQHGEVKRTASREKGLGKSHDREQAVTLAGKENRARIPPLCGGRLLLRGDA